MLIIELFKPSSNVIAIMPQFTIPGRPLLDIQHLVLDYNGTLAVDGELLSPVKSIIEQLTEQYQVHIVTADTFGKARQQLEGIENIEMKILSQERQDHQKADYVKRLGALNVMAIGNGSNDALMLRSALIGICVIEGEGAAASTMQRADLICRDIHSALQLLLHPKRLEATLRT